MPWNAVARSPQVLPHPLVHRITHLVIPKQKYYHGFVWFQRDPERFNYAAEPAPEMLINSDRFTSTTVDEDIRYARPSSAHIDGVVMGFADGQVRFVNDSIDYRVYQALLTLRGKSSNVPWPEFILTDEAF